MCKQEKRERVESASQREKSPAKFDGLLENEDHQIFTGADLTRTLEDQTKVNTGKRYSLVLERDKTANTWEDGIEVLPPLPPTHALYRLGMYG